MTKNVKINISFSRFVIDLHKLLKNNLMKLKFLDAKEFESNMKCTVQSNGKLNFSASAIHSLGLNNQKSVRFALNEEGKASDDFLMIVLDYVSDEAFKVNKAGNYFYLNAKGLFDKFGIDYKGHSVIFDIVKTDELVNDLPIFKLIRRKGKARKAK